MTRTRQFLVLLASGIGACALLGSPVAAADENGGGGPDHAMLPPCETMGGSSVLGGQITDCASPGNSQLTATPSILGSQGVLDPAF